MAYLRDSGDKNVIDATFPPTQYSQLCNFVYLSIAVWMPRRLNGAASHTTTT